MQSEKPARSPLRTIGGPREFSTFALLVLFLAIAVGLVVHRDHRQAKGAASQPATAQHAPITPNHRARRAPEPSVPADAAASTADYEVWVDASARKFNYSAAQDLVNTAINPAWNLALGLSNQILNYAADSLVNPVSGDRVIFNAAPAMFNMAAAILALAMLSFVAMVLAGPVYVGWKSWRLSRFRFRSH